MAAGVQVSVAMNGTDAVADGLTGRVDPASYAALLEELYGLRRFGVKMGLTSMERLVAALGYPGRSRRFVHVAGTNGKGSVCAMVESILRAAGYRVGMFTSPHLVEFGERIQVNRQLARPADVARWYGRLREVGEALGREDPARRPTFFETTTAMALLAFDEADVDWVVWETGLGGRLDCTNVVTPAVSVITSVGRDHERTLGDTLGKIAFEKAGIIKPRVPVITGELVEEAAEEVQRIARERNARLRVAASVRQAGPSTLDGQPIEADGKRLILGLLGDHQRANAGIVLEAVVELRRLGANISDEAVRDGLAGVRWAARGQCLRKEPPVFLDGAHNPDGIAAAVRMFEEVVPMGEALLIYGSLREKDYRRSVQVLSEAFGSVLTVPIWGESSADPSELSALFCAANPLIRAEAMPSFEAAWASVAGTGQPILITGSLYLAGEVLRHWEAERR